MIRRSPQRPVEWVELILGEPRRVQRRRLLEQVPDGYRETVRRAVEAEFRRRRGRRIG